jgi:hypothetical protein
MATDTPRDDCRATADGGAALWQGDKTVGHVKPRSAGGVGVDMRVRWAAGR